MFSFGVRRALRGGGGQRLGPISSAPDPLRMSHNAVEPDHLGIVPPFTRDWGQYQTFARGNYLPGMTVDQSGQQRYAYQAIRVDTPGTASFQQLRGGALTPQLGAVTQGRILDRLRAAWQSTQG